MPRKHRSTGNARRGIEDFHLPRHLLPLPPERRAEVGFVVDAEAM